MRGTCILVLILAATASASVSGPSVVFDQSIGPITNPRFLVMRDTNLSMGQTITSGLSGVLSRVEVQVTRSSAAVTAPITLNITPVSAGGTPNIGTPLGSFSLNAADVSIDPLNPDASFVSFDVRGAGIAVTPGLRLGLMLTTTQPYPTLGAPAYIMTAFAQNISSYAGGDMWYRNSNTDVFESDAPSDHMVRTFVELPEPTAGVVAAVVLSLVVTRRSKHN